VAPLDAERVDANDLEEMLGARRVHAHKRT